jgi:hypothetical protein
MFKPVRTFPTLIVISISLLIAACSGNKSTQELTSSDTITLPVPDHSAQQRGMQDAIYGGWLDTVGFKSTDNIYIAKMSEISVDQVEALSQSGIHVAGYRLGQYNGSMKALLFGEWDSNAYGLVHSVIDYLSKGDERQMNAFTAFEQLSGLSPYTEKSASLPFKNVNPAFIDWASLNLIPDPGRSLYGYQYQTLYDSIFSAFFHKLVLTQIYLERVYDRKVLMDRYYKQISEDSIQCGSWLSTELGNLNVIDHTGKDPFTGYGQHVFLGFWLRRSMDGSEESLKKALITVMMNYDKDWYLQAINNYTYNLVSKFPGVSLDQIEEPKSHLEVGTFYQVHVDKANVFERPSVEAIPKEFVWDKTLVHIDEVRKVDEHDMTLVWARTKINGNDRWILGNYLYDSVQNLADYKSLVIEGGFDTTVSPMRAKISLRNSGKRPMEIPEAQLRVDYKIENTTGGGTVFATERMNLEPGASIVLIDDNVVMNGYNQSQLWYAPESHKSVTLLYYNSRFKGPVSLKYSMMFNNSLEFMSQPSVTTLIFPLAERLVDTKQYESWLRKK